MNYKRRDYILNGNITQLCNTDAKNTDVGMPVTRVSNKPQRNYRYGAAKLLT